MDEAFDENEPGVAGKVAVISCGVMLLVASLAVAGFLVLTFSSGGSEDLGIKYPVATIGQTFSTEEVHEAYQTLRDRIGFGFPEGTQVDVVDDGFDRVTGCFTLPSMEAEWFVASYLNLSQASATYPIPEIAQLTVDNQVLPESAVSASVKRPTEWNYPIRMMYDPVSFRLWVVCQYPGWFD